MAKGRGNEVGETRLGDDETAIIYMGLPFEWA